MESEINHSELIGKPKDLITKSLESGKALFDDKKDTWNRLVNQILSKNGNIITLRGAGSINGADKTESDRILEYELIPHIQETAQASHDEAKVAKFQAQLNQRQNGYGTHWSNDGKPRLAIDQFPNLNISCEGLETSNQSENMPMERQIAKIEDYYDKQIDNLPEDDLRVIGTQMDRWDSAQGMSVKEISGDSIR